MIANLHDHLRASRQCLFFLRGAHKWMFPLTAGPARKTNEATVAIGDKEGRDEKGRGRKDAPRFRWRRPIHGGAGYERMPDGCIWSALGWFAGAALTFTWIVVRGWPSCGDFGDCLSATLWLGIKAAFFAIIWPVYWVLQIF
jgi:hypothetical protein